MRAVLPLLLLGVLATAGCSVPVPSAGPSSPDAAPARTSVAVVGDSITRGASADFTAATIDPLTWEAQVLGEDRVFAGGWAVAGATTADMRAAVPVVDADVLIVLAGTNDVLTRVPFATSAGNIEAVVRIVGGDRVIVSAIPPIDLDPPAAVAYNEQLASFVRRRGWEWVPTPPTLSSAGTFRPGLATDGVHPTPEGAEILGEAIRRAVERPAPDPD